MLDKHELKVQPQRRRMERCQWTFWPVTNSWFPVAQFESGKIECFAKRCIWCGFYSQNLRSLLVCSWFYRGRNLPCQLVVVSTKVACLIQCLMRSETFDIPTGQSQIIREDVFNAEPIPRMVLALCLNGHLSKRWADTPLAFEEHKLKQVSIMRNGPPIVEYNTWNTQVYYKTIQNLHFDQDGPPIN